MTAEHRSGCGLALAVAGCAAAATVLLLSSGQVWLDVALPATPPLPGARDRLTGQDLAPTLAPIGILVGAAGLALIATRRLGRLLVGLVLAASGLLAAGRIGFLLYDDAGLAALGWAQARSAAAADSPLPVHDMHELPAVVALAAAVLALAVGLATIRGSRRWPVMGVRYERRTRSGASVDAPASESAIWAALDRGIDPTAGASRPAPRQEREATRGRPLPGG